MMAICLLKAFCKIYLFVKTGFASGFSDFYLYEDRLHDQSFCHFPLAFFLFCFLSSRKRLRELSPGLSIFILSSLFSFDSDLFLFLCFRRWHSLQPRQFIYPQNQPVCNYRVINTNWILQQSLTTPRENDLLTTPMTCSGNAMKWLLLIIILIIVLTNFTLYIAQKYTVDMT